MLSVMLIMMAIHAPHQVRANDLSQSELHDLINNVHSSIRDVEFVFEGKLTVKARTAISANKYRPDYRFQGVYAYRADGATHIETYTKDIGEEENAGHGVRSLLKSDLSRASYGPDGTIYRNSLVVDRGMPGSLSSEDTPETFFLLPFWHPFKRRPDRWRITFEGFEVIDDHECARVLVDRAPEYAGEGKELHRLWLDLRRGGHALRRERYSGDRLWISTKNIKLAEFKASGAGEVIWLPVRGTFEDYRDDTEFRKEPVTIVECGIVLSSVVVNQGLADRRFSVEWTSGRSRSPEFRQAIDDFSLTPRRPAPSPPLLRTDPIGVAKHQEEKLAEADRQKRRLDASPNANRWFDGTVAAQVALACIAVGIIIAAIRIKRAQ
jgi:hypothetical protein